MDKKNKRPVYLNLLRIRLPVGGVASIVHRLTGVLLVLLTAPALYALQRSLESPAAYEGFIAGLRTLPGRLGLLLALWLLAQHFFSGLRHLLLDVDIGVERSAARASAWLSFVLSALTVAVVGLL